MLPTDVALKALLRRLGMYHGGGDGEYQWCCPFCDRRHGSPDVKWKLHVNLERSKFICFRCEFKGDVPKLLKALGISEESQALDIDVLAARANALGKRKRSLVGEASDMEAIQYPCDVLPIGRGMQAWRYLVNDRELFPSMITNYRMVVGTGYWASRVFIPTLQDGQMVFWVARAIDDSEPKYLNPGGGVRRRALFNYDRAKVFPTIAIAEGVLSAVCVGENAVATFGKLVTQEQIDLLLATRAHKFVVVFDGDATHPGVWKDREGVPRRQSVERTSAYRLASALSKAGRAVEVALLGKVDDPASVTVPEMRDCLESTVPFDWKYKALITQG